MNILTKILIWVKARQKEFFLAFCMLLIAFIGYNLGKLNALTKTPISIIDGQADVYSAGTKEATDRPVLDKRVVASKNSDKYHFSWCSGAKRIKEENKLWFETEAAAQAAGYTKAGNCN
jgi:hypothetical protein